MLAAMVIIAGIDLAWSGRKPTGLCAIEFGATARIVHLTCEVLDADGVFAWLDALGSEVIAGIDAPLIATPARTAEAAMARRYGSRGVYAYAARPDFLERHRIAEGPRLGAMLGAAGWNLDPAAAEAPRTALEVFPHAICVAMLGADRALTYKKGRLSTRASALEVLRGLLQTYCRSELPSLEGELALDLPVSAVGGRELKAAEDRLDAIACAFAAYHAWKYGLRADEIFGDAVDGYIAVPARP